MDEHTCCPEWDTLDVEGNVARSCVECRPWALFNAAEAHLTLGRPMAALMAGARALDEAHSPDVVALAARVAAEASLALNEPSRSLTYSALGWLAARRVGAVWSEAACRMLTGRAHSTLGRSAEAAKAFMDAAVAFQRANDDPNSAIAYTAACQAHAASGDIARAEHCAEQAVAVAAMVTADPSCHDFAVAMVNETLAHHVADRGGSLRRLRQAEAAWQRFGDEERARRCASAADELVRAS